MGASPLVTTEWLSEHLHDADLRVLDASWYLPGDARDPRAEYLTKHIPGAAFFDIDAVSDKGSDLPHMLPSAGAFEEAVQLLGISSTDLVIIYDAKGIYSAPRVWWTFKAMGHENCAVLDGGLPKWCRENRPTTSSAPSHPPGIFRAAPAPALARGSKALMENITTRKEQVLDARSPGRFAGLEQEPRAGVKPGHIPGSFNTYYAELVDEDGTLRSRQELNAYFKERAIDLASPIATTCGSGITAAIVYLAAHVAGASKLALYDGSWTEWGSLADAPIDCGPKRQ